MINFIERIDGWILGHIFHGLAAAILWLGHLLWHHPWILGVLAVLSIITWSVVRSKRERERQREQMGSWGW